MDKPIELNHLLNPGVIDHLIDAVQIQDPESSE
jgi:hypothetical protein